MFIAGIRNSGHALAVMLIGRVVMGIGVGKSSVHSVVDFGRPTLLSFSG